MNNKPLEELFDIEAARSAVRYGLDYSASKEEAKRILKAATAGREYQLVPELPPWFVNGERIGLPSNGEEVEYKFHVSDKWHKGVWIGSVDVGSHLCMTVWGVECEQVISGNFEVRPPKKPKKIDHSSLVGSGIDCTYDEGEGEYVNDYHPAHIQYLKSIRMNHPMLISNEQAKRIPIGYTIDIGQCFDDMVAITVTGIKDGYEL